MYFIWSIFNLAIMFCITSKRDRYLLKVSNRKINPLHMKKDKKNSIKILERFTWDLSFKTYKPFLLKRNRKTHYNMYSNNLLIKNFHCI